MSRTWINFILDTLLLVVFTGVVWVAATLKFVFPPGPEAAGWRLWGLDYVGWSNVQFILIAIMLAGVVLHVMLHWTWVCGVVASRFGREKKGKLDDGIRTLYGVGLLIVILHLIGIALTAASLMVEDPAEVESPTAAVRASSRHEDERRHHRHHGPAPMSGTLWSSITVSWSGDANPSPRNAVTPRATHIDPAINMQQFAKK
jgi:hypothetical protein